MDVLPNIPVKRLAVKLKASAEKMVKKGHPWVFGNSIIKQNKEGNAGDLVIIYDTKKNSVLAIGLFDPNSPIRIKIIHFGKPVSIDENWFINTISKAYSLRKPLLETDTNSYRLLFGENDQMPGFIADIYDHILVIKLYSSIWLPYLHKVVPQLTKISGCGTVVLRLSRSLQAKGNTWGLKDGQVLLGNLKEETVVFKEHGVLFSANVIKGHKTGYFLDHRHNRKKVGHLSKGKRVLDVFSYAGGFTTHALVGGAKEVLSIDISKHALNMAAANVALNSQKGIHRTMVADAFEALQALKKKGELFDIVVIDPPSFAKRESEIIGAKNSYARLTKLGLNLVAFGGILVMASCSSRIHAHAFFGIVEQQLSNSTRNFEILEKTGHDIDHPITFPEGAYLKCGYYRII